MKVKDKILFSLFLICTHVGKGQVNLHNATPEFKIPIFDFVDKNNRLSLSLSLNYKGGNGIKVNDIASDVGLGWELSSPGVIIRQQNGEPDDQKKMNSLTYVPWKDYYPQGFWYVPPPTTEVITLEHLQKYIYGDGYLFNSVNPELPISSSASYVPAYEIPNNPGLGEPGFKPPLDQLQDIEQDVFSFEFNGRRGSFVFSKNGEIKTLEDSKLKISKTLLDMSASNIRTQIKSFTITDEFGIQYVFNDNSLEELCAYKRTRSIAYDGNGNYIPPPDQPFASPSLPHIDTYDAFPINQYVITKWYLSDIINPLTTKLIHFDYDSYPVDYLTSKNLIEASLPSSYIMDKRISITNVRAKSTEKRLKTINLPNGAFAQYDYNPTERVDLINSNSLKKISINAGGHQISQEFEYGYFVKTEIKNENYLFSDLEKKYARLCLKSISKIGENSDNGGTYTFDYHTGVGSTYTNDNVPPRLLLPTDVYGYYNYYSSAEYDPSELDHNYIFPNYFYAANYFDLTGNIRRRHPSNPCYKNGLIQRITNPYKGTIEFEYEPNLQFDDSQLINNKYYGGARVAKTIQFDGLNHSNDIINEYKFIKPDGSCSIWGNEPTLTNNFSVLSRQYKSRVTVKAGILAKEIPIPLLLFIGFTLTGSEVGNSFYQAESYVWNLMLSLYMSNYGYNLAPNFVTIQHNHSSYSPSSFKNPLPWQFSRVEISKKSASLNSGKTIVEFTSDQDYPIDVPVYTFPFSREHRAFNLGYGLTKKITILNSSNNKVKEVENFYDYKKNIIFQTNYASQYWLPLTTFSARYLDPILNFNFIPSDAVVRKIYYPITGRVELTRTTETIYNSNGGQLITNTDFFYNANNYLLARKQSIDSRGNVNEFETYYPEDYDLTNIPIMQDLVTNNIVNIPISTETWKTKLGGTPEMISTSVTEIDLAPNGDYKPTKLHLLQTDKPVPQSTIGIFDPKVLVRNPVSKQLIFPVNEITYDIAGNPIKSEEVQGNRVNSVFYAYNNTFPVATISNADVNEIAYTSFESFQMAFVFKNWDLSNGQVLTEYTPTGTNCYSLTTNYPHSIIQTNPPIAITKDYKLSFWASSNGFSVNNGVTPSVTGPTISGWTYYEFNLPSGSASPIITGNCKIDELRLYPKGAGMVTSTYEVGVGKTSECDLNNKITYYEYDGLGRISKVLDENHNIIKTYEYHFKN